MNLSKKFRPSIAQRTLLNRGLTFIPTKGYNKNLQLQCKYDIQQYHRRIKLAAFYGDKNETRSQPFTPKSYWSPPNAQLPPQILNLIKTDNEYFQNHFNVGRIESNLTVEEIKALTELKGNKQIVIKPADKGSAVVILDKRTVFGGRLQTIERQNILFETKKTHLPRNSATGGKDY